MADVTFIELPVEEGCTMWTTVSAGQYRLNARVSPDATYADRCEFANTLRRAADIIEGI